MAAVLADQAVAPFALKVVSVGVYGRRKGQVLHADTAHPAGIGVEIMDVARSFRCCLSCCNSCSSAPFAVAFGHDADTVCVVLCGKS